MHAVAEDARAPKMTQPASADDPYALLLLAIVHRAVHDAQAHWTPLGAANPVQVRALLFGGTGVSAAQT